MKNIFTTLLLAATCLLSACNDDDAPAVKEYLPVTYANIAGTWKLSEWNGEATTDDRYCYLVIERKANEETGNRALTMYTNIDSDKSRTITSVYELEDNIEMDEDPATAIIKGIYDHSAGFWNNDYLISEVDSDRMVWTVTEDADDISVYVRCEAVPEDIVAGTRAIK